MKIPRILVLGFGNPGRADDGLGPAIVERVEALGWPAVATDADYQLNIEDAALMAGFERVLLVDASRDAPDPLTFELVQPAAEIAFTSHSLSPGALLAICEEHFHAMPETWLMGVRGYDFELREGLSDRGAANMEAAWERVLTLLDTWMEVAPHA